jgi:hypothetical protein
VGQPPSGVPCRQWTPRRAYLFAAASRTLGAGWRTPSSARPGWPVCRLRARGTSRCRWSRGRRATATDCSRSPTSSTYSKRRGRRHSRALWNLAGPAYVELQDSTSRPAKVPSEAYPPHRVDPTAKNGSASSGGGGFLRFVTAGEGHARAVVPPPEREPWHREPRRVRPLHRLDPPSRLLIQRRPVDSGCVELRVLRNAGAPGDPCRPELPTF